MKAQIRALLAAWLLIGAASTRSEIPAASPLPGPEDKRPVVPLADRFPLPDEKTVPFGPEMDSLSLRVVVAPVLTHGQPMPLVLQVRNLSKQTRYLHTILDPNFKEWIALKIVGPDGKPVTTINASGTSVHPNNFKPIAPGETMRFDFSNLRDLFSSYVKVKDDRVLVDGFGKEGKYTLSYTYKSPKCPERYVTGNRAVLKDGKRVVEEFYADTPKEVLAGAWQGSLAASTSFEVRPLKAEDLTVHEWGVFTVFSDVKHANTNRRAEWGSLPADFYYDGLMPAPDHLRCTEVSDTAIKIKNTAKFAIGHLFVIDRRTDRKDKGLAAAYRAEPIPAGGEVSIPTAPATADALANLSRNARGMLLEAGLFEPEADSLLKLWHKEFFAAEGLTVFCLLPPAEYDRMLPLEVTPHPVKQPVRVGIAYHPRFENGPKVREKVAALIAGLNGNDFATRDASGRTLEQMGPWAVPQLLEALAAKPNLETTRRIEQILQRVDAGEWLRQALPAKP